MRSGLVELVTGPMFAGPKQPDFFCSTPQHLSGFDLAGPFLDADCSLPTRVDYYYRASNGAWKPYAAAAPRPSDMTTTTTSAGDTVDFVIRWERGTINRFIYTIAVLDPTRTGPSSLPYWNRKLIYYFGGGVAIGHYQGSNNRDESRYPYGLGQGYAIAWSTGQEPTNSVGFATSTVGLWPTLPTRIVTTFAFFDRAWKASIVFPVGAATTASGFTAYAAASAFSSVAGSSLSSNGRISTLRWPTPPCAFRMSVAYVSPSSDSWPDGASTPDSGPTNASL